MTYEFKLPDVGEGLAEGEVIRWHVREGESVTENQPLVNVLTDKAEVEIPSPKTGRIARLMAAPGQKVKVGAVLVVFDLGGNGAAVATATETKTTTASSPRTEPPPRGGGGDPGGDPGTNVLPAVRKLAQDLKVDLSGLRGTGPGGRITEEDVRKAAGTETTATAAPPAASGPLEERIAFIGIRRRTAEKMALSKRVIPHVTHADEADVTALAALREELRAEADGKGVKLTFLPFILKALVRALKEFPDLNAVLDEAGGAIVRKRQCNIGIAAATEQGLVVPVLKEADKKDVWALAAELRRLAEKARANRLDPSQLQGGTFTVTNIGPIGGLYATPIVNHPEVGILAVMRIRKQPVVRDGAVAVRDMVNLCLSFDHRVLDGAEAARFMNALVKHLENPRTLL